jgi:DNA-binding transcriptional LysR family regulator
MQHQSSRRAQAPQDDRARNDARIYEKRDGSLRVTEAGRVVLPFAKEIFLQHDAAFAAIAESKDGSLGRVRIGAGPSFRLIKSFRRRFPSIDAYVETGDSNHLISRLRSGLSTLFLILPRPLRKTKACSRHGDGRLRVVLLLPGLTFPLIAV